ncbi:MAG TPA: hypothetical protein VGC13_25215 [Longimicrobium sp.]|uniref:hypothetical protein n=1 Tax=Longimicrobium sp. TaxID=2029185 RepID=UPI002EDA748E
MNHSLSRLLIPLLLTPALAPAVPAQGRPEVAGSRLVRVEGPQPFTVVLSVDEHGGVLTPRALSRQQTIFPSSAARTDSGFVAQATAWERENTLDVAVRRWIAGHLEHRRPGAPPGFRGAPAARDAGAVDRDGGVRQCCGGAGAALLRSRVQRRGLGPARGRGRPRAAAARSDGTS